MNDLAQVVPCSCFIQLSSVYNCYKFLIHADVGIRYSCITYGTKKGGNILQNQDQ